MGTDIRRWWCGLLDTRESSSASADGYRDSKWVTNTVESVTPRNGFTTTGSQGPRIIPNQSLIVTPPTPWFPSLLPFIQSIVLCHHSLSFSNSARAFPWSIFAVLYCGKNDRNISVTLTIHNFFAIFLTTRTFLRHFFSGQQRQQISKIRGLSDDQKFQSESAKKSYMEKQSE